MSKTIYDLTDLLTIFRIDFKAQVNKIKKEYEEAKKTIPNNFIGKRRSEEYEKAEKKYRSDWEELKTSWKEQLNDTFEELEVSSRAKAGVINTQLVEQARLFLDVPLTVDEFGAIVHSLGNRNYYADRVLESIAEKNGIAVNGLTPTLEPLKLEPSLNTKLNILNDLKRQTDQIIMDFGTLEEDSYSRTINLCPDVLRLAEQRYTNGLYIDYLSSKQIAERVIDAVRYGGGRGKDIIDNALSNADAKTKKSLLNALSNSTENAIVYSIEKSKARAEIKAFKEKESALYTEAEKGMEKLYSVADDTSARENVISQYTSNPHFKELLENDTSLKSRFNDGYHYVQA